MTRIILTLTALVVMIPAAFHAETENPILLTRSYSE